MRPSRGTPSGRPETLRAVSPIASVIPASIASASRRATARRYAISAITHNASPATAALTILRTSSEHAWSRSSIESKRDADSTDFAARTGRENSAMPCHARPACPNRLRSLAGGPCSGVAGALSTGSDSPVRMDSSALNALPLAQQAVRRNPIALAQQHDVTSDTSRPAMRCSTPSRMTSARGLDRSRSACKHPLGTALLQSADGDDRRTSSWRGSALRARRRARHRSPTPAINSRNIGSAKTSHAMATNFGVRPVGSSLGPSSANRPVASALVRPSERCNRSWDLCSGLEHLSSHDGSYPLGA